MPLASRPSARSLIGRAVLAGLSTGLRSIALFGVLASERNDGSIKAGWKQWPVLKSDIGRKGLQLAWLGEMIADKLPITPPRIEPGPLSGRMVIGALAGIAITTGRSGMALKLAGALAGVAGAIGGAHGGYRARTYLTKEVGLPDLPGALLGDATAIMLARKAVKG